MTAATLTLLYGLVGGIQFGAGVGGHALRLVVLDDGKSEPSAREFIAIAAITIYTWGAILCVLQNSLGLWIAAIFPFVGITAVLVTGAKVDEFQVTLGGFQLVASALAMALLCSL